MQLLWTLASAAIILKIKVTTAVLTAERIFDDFKLKRDKLLRRDGEKFLGSELKLSQDEQFANVYIMREKMAELDVAFQTADFLPAKSFYLSRQDIKDSLVYQFLKSMPKGAALHTHHISLGPVSWVISNLTYRNNLYMRLSRQEPEALRFGWFQNQPTNTSNGMVWKNVNEARKIFGANEVDEYLREHLTSSFQDTENINDLWKNFKRAVRAQHGILLYLPALKDYLYAALEEMKNDNIQHVQIRTTLPVTCKTMLDENTADCPAPMTDIETAMVFKEVTDKFESDHSEHYCGTSLIISRSRKDTVEKIDRYLDLTGRLQSIYPDFVIGFDIVGQEDIGRPLIDFAEMLILAKLKYPNLKFFFHAGETNWQGSSSNANLVDAIFLNVSRIGHGYSILKQPEVKKLALELDIPLEVCPISNQVLGLVNDLRNHPVVALIQEGFPMVLASDDLGTWESQGLSDDFYEAFMAMTSRTTDLRFLKKLVLNSITYSDLSKKKKENCMALVKRKWFDYMRTFV